MNLLFRRIAIILTVIEVLVTIGLAAYLVWLRLKFFFYINKPSGDSSAIGLGFMPLGEKLRVAEIQNFTRLLLIASITDARN